MRKSIDNTRNIAYTQLRDKVKQARLKLGWSQQRLATELNVSVRSIQHFETGVHQPTALFREAIEAWTQVVEAGADLAWESLPPTYRTDI